ncbi:MAG: ATP-binding protein [Marmoricola sp.]
MPLRARLSLVVAVAVAVLVASGGLFFVHQLRTGLDNALDTTLRARADALLQRLGADGTSNFQDAGASGMLPPKEALAQVVDGHNTVLDSSEGVTGGPLLSSTQLRTARRGPVSLTTDGAGVSLRLLAVPVPGSGRPPTVLVLGTTREVPATALSRVRTALLFGGLVAVVLSAWGAWLLAGAALRPVERMRSEAEEITAGDTEARLAVPRTRDEVARLGRTLNSMLERLNKAVAQQRDFVADAGHELRTPLTFLRTELELAGRPGRTREELRAAVSRAVEDTNRLTRLAEDLLLLARSDVRGALFQLAPMLLGSPARDAVEAARSRAADAGVTLCIDLSSEVPVEADHDRLRQVVDNLLDNALRFSPTGGAITLRVGVGSGSPSRAVLDISDEGPGFPSDFLPHAFERFRRADTARNVQEGGAGLGLAIVASLVRAHGGTVTADNQNDGGAHVRIELPIRPPDPTRM